jgi:hypothetical protein
LFPALAPRLDLPSPEPSRSARPFTAFPDPGATVRLERKVGAESLSSCCRAVIVVR